MVTNKPVVEQITLSKRILVLGSSGSGKTYLSRRLSEILGIEPIHLDAHLIRPGWIGMPQDDWRRILASLIQKECWIMDGTYESPRLACLWRVIKRKLTVDDAHRPDAPPGQKLDRDFLRYIWRYPTVTRPLIFERIKQYNKAKNLLILRGPKEIGQFITETQAQVEGGKN